MDDKTKRPKRQPILILSHPDGHLEVFGDRHLDVHLARVPTAFSAEGERQAEAVAELLLPVRYRPLFRADMLRKNGTTRPLFPSVLADTFAAKETIKSLNRVSNMAMPIDGAAEAATAKLRRERRAAS